MSLDPVSARAVVETSLCKGCGACVAGCRSDAVSLKNVGNEQIIFAVEAAMEVW
jgi:heterodisulfide reductase subunit A